MLLSNISSRKIYLTNLRQKSDVNLTINLRFRGEIFNLFDFNLFGFFKLFQTLRYMLLVIIIDFITITEVNNGSISFIMQY